MFWQNYQYCSLQYSPKLYSVGVVYIHIYIHSHINMPNNSIPFKYIFMRVRWEITTRSLPCLSFNSSLWLVHLPIRLSGWLRVCRFVCFPVRQPTPFVKLCTPFACPSTSLYAPLSAYRFFRNILHFRIVSDFKSTQSYSCINKVHRAF